MKEYVNEVVNEFSKSILAIYTQKNNVQDFEFIEKLNEYKFYAHDEIYRHLQRNQTFGFNTNFDKKFKQFTGKQISLTDILEMHFVDIFHKSYNDVIGTNMNIMVYGDREYAKLVVEGYYNGKKKVFRECEITEKINEQTI